MMIKDDPICPSKGIGDIAIDMTRAKLLEFIGADFYEKK